MSLLMESEFVSLFCFILRLNNPDQDIFNITL